MKDKNYDDFFDNVDEDKAKEAELLNMVETMDVQPSSEFSMGDRVSGTILSIGDSFIFVDVGAKNEAMISKREFMDEDDNVSVNNGDTIEAFIVSTENDEIIMSKSLGGQAMTVEELIEAKENETHIEGKVTGVNKGGFNVNLAGKKAFCPFSHIDLNYNDTPNEYLAKTFNFVITRVENRGRNIVLSRLPILDEVLVKELDAFEEKSVDNAPVVGKISKIADFGLFVSFGAFEGLVHISEVSWDRAEKLNDTFNVGQEVQCVVLGIERKKPLRNSKISLSLKALSDDPWTVLAEKVSVGDTVEGKITRLTNFGAFIQLFPGVEGLIHVSELVWGKKVRRPGDVVSVNETVKVSVLAIDLEKRSVSCSLKDIAENPWEEARTKYAVGTKVTGKVASKTKYGYFVDLDANITGLLTYGNIIKGKEESFAEGDEIEVTIDEVNTVDFRVALSHGIEREPEMSADEANAVIASQNKKETKSSSSEFGDLLKAALNKK